jgi:ubiquinone/menaquinone biosynthesis C-methylase UbiE
MWSLTRWDTPPRIDEAELIDDELQPFADLRASMADVRRANRFLGGTAVVARHARAWLRQERQQAADRRPVTFLDVATGSGELAKLILTIARTERVDARLIGLDYSAGILRIAREEIGEEAGLRLVRGTAFRLPLADNAVDYVTCSLAFHHFGFEGSIAALREMERVARRGWLVNDLRRARSAALLFRAVAAVFRMNRLTRHDGPASVLRAYSVDEYRSMPEAIGLREGEDFRVRCSPFYRVAIIRDKRPVRDATHP